MRRSSVAQVVHVGRRGVLGGLVAGSAELGLVVLKWTVIATVAAVILMVVGLVRLGAWAIREMRGKSVVTWHRDSRGYWRPYV